MRRQALKGWSTHVAGVGGPIVEAVWAVLSQQLFDPHAGPAAFKKFLSELKVIQLSLLTVVTDIFVWPLCLDAGE